MATGITKRLTEIRAKILVEEPFFGSLLMHLKLGLAYCKTAYTDMVSLVFDPSFLEKLSDEELKFVMKHEVLHVALMHCMRAKGHQPFLFNVACDIVVNSILMQAMEVEYFCVCGEAVMHKAPDGEEGYRHDAETVYNMLLESDENEKGYESGQFDTHEVWEKVEELPSLSDRWRENIIKAADRSAGLQEVPSAVRKVIKDMTYRTKKNWREILNRYVQYHFHDFDYTYRPPNATYLDEGLVIPSFKMISEELLEKIWFFVDTSGSVKSETLNLIFAEVQQILMQYPGMLGYISFFDTRVTEPKQFQSLRELNACDPKGGGGTNFGAIFKYVREHRAEYMPNAIVIITDGYAKFPSESAREGIPVLWIIVESNIEPPWGDWVSLKK